MRKRWYIILLCALCVLCALFAVACNPNEGETSTTTAEQTMPESEQNTEPEVTDAMTTETEPESDGEESETESNPDTEEPGKTTLYQLAPEKNSLMQSYVIKTPNGKLIVIDGGIDGEGKDRSPYMPAALRAIAGVGEDEYFEVEAWFLSHAHKDHTYELSKMLGEYSEDSNYKINHIYFDFPAFGTEEYPGSCDDLAISKIVENLEHYGEVIGADVPDGSTYYDVLNGAVINAESVANGLSFEIDGVKIDVLQTWSPADGCSNFNDTSIVLRVWIGDQSVLFLGDLGTIGGQRLLNTYGDRLKSDIVQMAHHGQRGVSKSVYAAIDAQVHLWPTPIWVWNNANKIYQIDEVRAWLYGETFLEADPYNIVAGLYAKYPVRPTNVFAWARVMDGMKIEFPYILPYRPSIVSGNPHVPSEDFEPMETPYVSDGLVHYYSGTLNNRDGHDRNATVWADLVGGYDMNIVKNANNYFTENGLYTSGAKHNFPQKVVDVVNGDAFTVELLLGDFLSVGKDYNTFLNSSNDHFALFRRNSVNELELKTLNNERIKIPGCLDLLQNSLVSITYQQGDYARIYVNGELKGELSTAEGSLMVDDFFIGHDGATKLFQTTYRSIRFYDRALTAEEVAANATVDGVYAAE